MRLLAVIVLLLSAAPADALEIRFQPADIVYVYENKGVGAPLGYYTAVLQNIAIVNSDDVAVDLQGARIDVIHDVGVVQQLAIARDVMEAQAARFNAYAAQGALEFYDFHFQTKGYLAGIKFPQEPVLGKGDAVVLMHQALLLRGVPKSIKIIVQGTTPDGTPVTAEGSVDVAFHASPNLYGFPVRGRWAAMAAPSLHSHHRWASIQEFALDLIQFGEGTLTHAGDGTQLTQYYCYEQPVYAASAGTVVAARGDMSEADGDLRQADESLDAFSQRSAARQQALLAEGFEMAMGNHVIIEHEGGEHSHYLHLAQGSLRVEVGDQVKRGDWIGAVGNSGNSTEPHLHFHVTDGPSLSHSRSLPVMFQDIQLWPDPDDTIHHVQSGQIIVTVD